MFARTRMLGVIVATAVFLSPGCKSPEGPQSEGAGQQKHKRASQKDATASAQEIELTPAKIQANTYIAAGRLHESQGRLPQAIQQFEFAAKEDPTNADVIGHIAILYDRNRNSAAAEAAYKRALQIAPKNPYLHNNLAFSYIMGKKWSQAQAELNEALAMNPEFPRARVNLAMVLAQQDKFEESLKQFQMALPPEDAHYNLGLMYQSKQKQVEAAQEYKRALQANSKLVAAQERLKRLPAAVVGDADRKLEAERQGAELAKRKLEADRRAAELAKRQLEAERQAVELAKRNIEAVQRAAERAVREAEAEREAAVSAKRKLEAERQAAERESRAKAENEATRREAAALRKPEVKPAARSRRAAWEFVGTPAYRFTDVMDLMFECEAALSDAEPTALKAAARSQSPATQPSAEAIPNPECLPEDWKMPEFLGVSMASEFDSTLPSCQLTADFSSMSPEFAYWADQANSPLPQAAQHARKTAIQAGPRPSNRPE